MHFDVAIVGLGTAGAAVAAACSDSGLRVVGFDRARLDATGARWCNGVPAWSFDEAGFDRPTGDELHGAEGTRFHLIAGWDGPSVTTSSVLDVDMRHLTTRLLDRARAHGADLRGDHKVLGFDGETLDTVGGPIRARVFVDASGLTGPSLDDRPTTPRTDLCVAAQQVHRLDDPEAAEAWFAARDARPGEIVCFTGVAGGYSIVNVRMHGDQVSILTGSIPGLGFDSGAVLLDRFVRQHPWIGAKIFGGSRALPLGQPHAVIASRRVARIGDSAGMVHAAHGSGIAQQMLAARLLANTLKNGGTPIDYGVAWQRQYGGVLAGADVFRRFSQTLSLSELRALVANRVLSSEMMADTLTQRPVRPSLRLLLSAARRLAKTPRVASRMAPVLARMKALELHHRRYPADRGQLDGWLRTRRRLIG